MRKPRKVPEFDVCVSVFIIEQEPRLRALGDRS